MPHPDMGAHWEGGHPDEGLLHEWLDEQLSDEAASHIALHVAACAECAGVVAEARGLIAASHRILSALDEVPAHVLPGNVLSGNVRRAGVLPEVAAPANGTTAGASSLAERIASESAENTSRVSPRTRGVWPMSWSRIGQIAAVLVVAVATPFVLRDRSAKTSMQTTSPTAASVSKSGVSGTVGDSMAAAERTLADAVQDAAPRGGVSQLDAAPPVTPQRVVPQRMQKASGLSPRADSVSRNASVASVAAGATDTAGVTGVAGTADAARVVGATGAAGLARAAGAAVGEARASERRSLTSPAPRSALSAPAVSGSPQLADTRGSALFDSVTVMRNVCNPSCIATTLHINALGVVRYTIGSGNAQRVVRSDLTPANRIRLGSVLLRAFPEADDRRGFVDCRLSADSPPTLQIAIAFGTVVTPVATARCAVSATDVGLLIDEIDDIADVSGLRRRNMH